MMIRFSPRMFVTGAIALTFALRVTAPAWAADPYEINVITPLTGIGAFIGKNEAAALGLLEKSVNDAGGVRGRQIKFVVQDDQSNPQVSVQLLNGLIAKKVPIVSGEIGESGCTDTYIDTYMPWADSHGISYLGWTWDSTRAPSHWNCSGGPALIKSYNGTPTAYGVGLKDHLAALAAAPRSGA